MSTTTRTVRNVLTMPVVWAFALTAAIALPASADDLLHARISHESGGALVRGSDDTDWSYATVNTIILPGDTLWIDQEGTLEVEMSGGSFLRMADKSKAELQALPPSASINAWAGSFYVQRVSRATGDVKLRTPAATINIDRDTQLRVDVVGEGSTTVSVRWGRASVVTDGGAPVEVTNGQRVYVDPGLLPSNPVPFDKTVEDSFDAWNRERARLLAMGDSALPTSVRVEQTPIGYSDLASYGDWVNVDNRQYWRPTIVQEYVPYRDGYWSYVPTYGYNWIGNYPFCYVTSHYGRWNYNSGYGWLWSYDPVWSPAWCATAYYGGNFVWAPLDYYNRPCSYGATFVVGGIPFSIGYSSYCRAPDLYYGPCSVYPAYGSMFANVHHSDIYGWNIYSNQYSNSYSHYGSTALFREYNPRRVIRGIESGGAFTVAASHRARALNSELGRAEFASRATIGSRSLRTSQAGSARNAQIRNTSLNANTALDTGSTIRRAQRNVESLRGSDDSKPQATEARRARVASLERSATEAQNSKLPGATTRTSSARSVRGDGNVDTVRAQGERSANARNLSTGTPLDATNRSRASTAGRADRKAEDNTPTITDATVPRARANRTAEDNTPTITDATVPRARASERSTERDARRLDSDTSHVNADPNARGRSQSATSRTLDDTRTRVTSQDGAGRTQAPDQARMREPNLPRISGGDGRNERSESLGTLPQVPQRTRSAYNAPVQTHTPEPSSSAPTSRIIGDSSRSNRTQARAQSYTPQTPAPIQMDSSRARNAAPQARVQAPQTQYQAPQQQYQAPQARVQAPRPQYQAPQQQYQAPQARVQAPQQQIQAPRQVDRSPISTQSRSIGSGGGGRSDGGSGGGGGGRGRSR